jgi:hypothetical protein
MTSHTAELRGAHFRPPAKAIIQALPTNHPLELRPEPSNPYDANAVAVWIDAKTIPEDALEELRYTLPGMGQDIDTLLEQRFWQLGYIAKEIAATVQEPIALLIEGHNVDAAASGEGFLWDGMPCRLSFGGDGKPMVKFDI